MPDIVVNGCKVRYQDIGTGTPVVLTPGGRWVGTCRKPSPAYWPNAIV